MSEPHQFKRGDMAKVVDHPRPGGCALSHVGQFVVVTNGKPDSDGDIWFRTRTNTEQFCKPSDLIPTIVELTEEEIANFRRS